MKAKNILTKRKIIILSGICFIFFILLIFCCSLRTQIIYSSQDIADNTYNKIIINADCDVSLYSQEEDFASIKLTGKSKQFFKKANYEINTKIIEDNLIIDVNNSAAGFFKDIRYEIVLTIFLPKVEISDCEIVLNSKQGIYNIDNVNASSFYAENIKGRFFIYNSNFDVFKLNGYSGYLLMQNNTVHDFGIENMRTGQVYLSTFNSSRINIDLIDGIIALDNIVGYQDALDVDLNFRKGWCIFNILPTSFLNININTQDAPVSVSLFSAEEVNCNLVSKKGKIQNDFIKSETDMIKININSEKGNIVLKDGFYD